MNTCCPRETNYKVKNWIHLSSSRSVSHGFSLRTYSDESLRLPEIFTNSFSNLWPAKTLKLTSRYIPVEHRLQWAQRGLVLLTNCLKYEIRRHLHSFEAFPPIWFRTGRTAQELGFCLWACQVPLGYGVIQGAIRHTICLLLAVGKTHGLKPVLEKAKAPPDSELIGYSFLHRFGSAEHSNYLLPYLAYFIFEDV